MKLIVTITSVLAIVLSVSNDLFASNISSSDQLKITERRYQECLEQLPAKARWGIDDKGQRGRRSWSKKTQDQVALCLDLRRDRDDLQATILLGTDLRALHGKLGVSDRQQMEREADHLAEYLVLKTRSLSQQYRMGNSALWHNFLVKIGSKEGGYCYHWAEELFKEMGRAKFVFFERAWGVHDQGHATENNAVILVRRGESIQKGIVFDPWRGRGAPYWRRVADDTQDWDLLFSEDQILYEQVIPSY